MVVAKRCLLVVAKRCVLVVAKRCLLVVAKRCLLVVAKRCLLVVAKRCLLVVAKRPSNMPCASGTDLLRPSYALLPEIEVANQTCCLTRPQYTDTGPTTHSGDPITSGAWQGGLCSSSF